jgi:CRP/FNR family transcriptional regulator
MVNSGSTSIAAVSSSFLAGLEPPAAQSILSAARIRRISAGRKISTEGYRATHFFLLQKGRARFYHLTKEADLVLLSWLAPGDVTGLVAILKSPPPYMVTTEAMTDCDVLVWEHSVICKLASRHPLLAENTLRIALSNLRMYIQRHIGLATKTAEERLAETLLRLSDKSGQFHPEGIEICATNDELSALADISPFTTSRVLSNWQRAGTLSKRRGRIVLRAPEALMSD